MLRRRGRGPRWAIIGVAALALVVVQGTFDLLQRGLKPSGCRWAATSAPELRRENR